MLKLSKNFRRFEDFPPIDLSPITIFVGENNAGKSTVIKGILAITDFFKHWLEDPSSFLTEDSSLPEKQRKNAVVERLKTQKFSFNDNYLAHIGTFKRALYNKAESNIITFNTTLGNQDISVEVQGDRNNEQLVYGYISRINLEYQSLGLNMIYDLQNDTAKVIFKAVDEADDQLNYLSVGKRKKAKAFLRSIPHTFEVTYEISNYYRKYSPDIIWTLLASTEIAISSINDFSKTENFIKSDLVVPIKPVSNIDEETKEFLSAYTKKVCKNPRKENWIFDIPNAHFTERLLDLEYIYAHAVTQTVIYSAKDTNDYLSRTIHLYASKPEAENRRQFIQYWMKELKIGEDFSISSVGGEAHIVKIQNFDDEWVNLSDKGMGSIQLMVLLFRLAITLPKQRGNSENSDELKDSRSSNIIIVEEPEQNLHPMLQSKLADLFFNLHEEYGYHFIIETHSEYLIRKTQLIVAKENKASANKSKEWENPFKVYYFKSDGVPYDMGYQKNGKFIRSFGTGFFDVSTMLSMDLLDLEDE